MVFCFKQINICRMNNEMHNKGHGVYDEEHWVLNGGCWDQVQQQVNVCVRCVLVTLLIIFQGTKSASWVAGGWCESTHDKESLMGYFLLRMMS